jgi:drug/metabolite transporter (DMT)-like permease
MLRGALYGLGAAAIWGSMYVVTDVLLETIPPFTLLVTRLILGGVVLALILWRSGARLPDRRSIPRLLGVGLVGFGVSLSAQFVGTDLSNAVNGSLVTSASPAFILVFAAIILRERLTLIRIAAVALATAGSL